MVAWSGLTESVPVLHYWLSGDRAYRKDLEKASNGERDTLPDPPVCNDRRFGWADAFVSMSAQDRNVTRRAK